MSTFLGVILLLGFLAFMIYEIIGIVRYFIDKKKSKINHKEDDVE